MNKLNIENDLPVNRKLSIWLDEHHYHYHCIPTTTHIYGVTVVMCKQWI